MIPGKRMFLFKYFLIRLFSFTLDFYRLLLILAIIYLLLHFMLFFGKARACRLVEERIITNDLEGSKALICLLIYISSLQQNVSGC